MNESEFSQLQVAVHDARRPLNRITMQAELIKLALEGAVPQEKALDALNKIIAGSKDCSDKLSQMIEAFADSGSGKPE